MLPEIKHPIPPDLQLLKLDRICGRPLAHLVLKFLGNELFVAHLSSG